MHKRIDYTDRIEALTSEHCSCLLGGNRGIYLPQCFAEEYGAAYLRAVENDHGDTSEALENLEILKAGPDHEDYDDAWVSVLDFGRIDGTEGGSLWIFQDSDLFAWDSLEAMRAVADMESGFEPQA